jgi:hypothetical protein
LLQRAGGPAGLSVALGVCMTTPSEGRRVGGRKAPRDGGAATSMSGLVLISSTERRIDVDQLRPLAAVPPPWWPSATPLMSQEPHLRATLVCDPAIRLYCAICRMSQASGSRRGMVQTGMRGGAALFVRPWSDSWLPWSRWRRLLARGCGGVHVTGGCGRCRGLEYPGMEFRLRSPVGSPLPLMSRAVPIRALTS